MSRRVGLNVGVIAVVIVAVAVVATVRSQRRTVDLAPKAPVAQPDRAQPPTENDAPVPTSTQKAPESQPERASLPKLVDLGASQCIPCRMMAPILEQVRAAYAGRVAVDVIDIREDREAPRRYGIRVIPTQIFYDAAGREVWRHEGFLPKQAIVAQLQQMGISP